MEVSKWWRSAVLYLEKGLGTPQFLQLVRAFSPTKGHINTRLQMIRAANHAEKQPCVSRPEADVHKETNRPSQSINYHGGQKVGQGLDQFARLHRQITDQLIA